MFDDPVKRTEGKYNATKYCPLSLTIDKCQLSDECSKNLSAIYTAASPLGSSDLQKYLQKQVASCRGKLIKGLRMKL
jgi:hypothetical protein